MRNGGQEADSVLREGAELERVVRRKADPDMVFLEEAKKKHLQEAYERGIRKGDGIRWASYEEGMILPLKREADRIKGRVGVLDREGNYVADSREDFDFCGGYPCEALP